MSEPRHVQIKAEERWAFVAHRGPVSRRARVAAWWNGRVSCLQVGVADRRRAVGAFSSGGRVVKLWPVRRDR